ncbi:(d)CMP kinase [Thermoflavimicrobium dichotomicum]
MRRFLVAIDGPAGAGKSTVARLVAEQLGLTYVDTGAMYRGVAWRALQEKVDVTNEEVLAQLAEATQFKLEKEGIRINGKWLKEELRTPEVSQLASAIAKMGEVRQALVRKQQEIARQHGVVMDGRDIGTHVLPHADVKVFLTASIEKRAKRRYLELLAKGYQVDERTLQEEIRKRDENDQTRKHSPLRQAEDAVFIDTSDLTVSEVVEKILELCRTKVGGNE